jgi:alkylation response protein AidB-like acyl-CoA dehydrogenase
MNLSIGNPQVDSNAHLLATRAQVLADVRAILPLVKSQADTAEANRDLSPECFAALVDSGALRLFVARRAGGLQAGYRTYLETTLEVASACGSAAWMCFITNHGDWHVGQMSQSVQDAVWNEGGRAKVAVPLTPLPGWRAEPVAGGYRVSGAWPYTSGSTYAKWALIAFPKLSDGGQPIDSIMGLVSMANVEVEDTWRVSGMAATGSHTLVVRDAFIPQAHTQLLSDMIAHRFPTPHSEEALYHMDVGVVFHTATLVPVVALAKVAYNLTLARITGSPKPMSFSFYADTTKAPATQFAMAQAAWNIETALEQLRATTEAIDAQAATGQPFAALERGRFAMRAAQGHRLCREAMDLLLDVQGAGSFALTNPMQRVWRDFAMATRHGMSVPGLKQEVYGRALLGAVEQHMTALV